MATPAPRRGATASLAQAPREIETSGFQDLRGSRSFAWWEIVEGFRRVLREVPEENLTRALGQLLKGLPVEGACVVDWPPDSEPLVLAASGQVDDPTHHDGFDSFMQVSLTPGSVVTSLLGGDPALSCALMSVPGRGRLALILWGAYPGRSRSEPLLRILLTSLDRFRPRPLRVPEALKTSPELTFPETCVPGESPAMASLYGQMQPLLQGVLPVLILGETGVGKEVLARTLHASSTRRDGPFVPVNCAAIPAELLEAELFGIGKGVATGVAERQGRFQLADGGTLFLDEIGDLPLSLQGKLLRALQEKEIQPLGCRPQRLNARIVACTNCDLKKWIEDGRFRRDLYYRVAGCVLRVPPLRERRRDIPVLLTELVKRFARECGKSVRGITLRALRALVNYEWPGNVRELEHEVRLLVSRCPDGQPIDLSILGQRVTAAPTSAGPAAAEESLDLAACVADLEGRTIREALKRTGGNRSRAACLLGVSRNGLGSKMRRLGL